MDESESSGGGAVRATYDWSSTSPSMAVVETVASAANRNPRAFGPLYEYIDPDALDALVLSAESVSAGQETTVTLDFAGHAVTVHSDGEVAVRPDAEVEN